MEDPCARSAVQFSYMYVCIYVCLLVPTKLADSKSSRRVHYGMCFAEWGGDVLDLDLELELVTSR